MSSVSTIEKERGDDRESTVEVERLHEMTGGQFREVGYVSDTPGRGIGEFAPVRLRGPNVPTAVGSISFKKTFLQPGRMLVEIAPHFETPRSDKRGEEIMPPPTQIPPDIYHG